MMTFIFSVRRLCHSLGPAARVSWYVLDRSTAVPHSLSCRVVPSGHLWSRCGGGGGHAWSTGFGVWATLTTVEQSGGEEDQTPQHRTKP